MLNKNKTDSFIQMKKSNQQTNSEFEIEIDSDHSNNDKGASINSSKVQIKQEPNAKSEEIKENDNCTKQPLNDVWIYDTVLRKWLEIKPQVKIQGSSSSNKKLKKEFEPRMAHSAVQLNQFVVLFGGFNSHPDSRNLINNELFVLSLDGDLGNMLSLKDLQMESASFSQIKSNINSLGEMLISDKSLFGKSLSSKQ